MMQIKESRHISGGFFVKFDNANFRYELSE
nr:MAG TPA: hypothetical protein [Caudoviricetes sp.]